jgi:PEP-CTERM motif-containing protein
VIALLERTGGTAMVSFLRQVGITAAAVCVGLGIAERATASPITFNYVTGSEKVTGTRNTPQYTDSGTTYGPFGWNFSYTRSFDGTKLTKNVEISFLFDADLGYTDPQRMAFIAAAEAGVEGIWNNRFKIEDSAAGSSFPLGIDLTTTGPFNQTVMIHKGSGTPNMPFDMTNWFVDESTASALAHEFGHMLGLFDEYIGGAVNQYPNPTLTATGLMGLGALNANPEMFSRYYQQYLDYMNTLNPGQNFRLQAIPEPPTWILIVIGAGAVGVFRRYE